MLITFFQIYQDREAIDRIVDFAAIYREKAIGYFKQTGSASPWSFTLRLLAWGALTIGLASWLEITIQPVLKRWFQRSTLDRI
jgi:hypothetical protein